MVILLPKLLYVLLPRFLRSQIPTAYSSPDTHEDKVTNHSYI